MLYTILLCTAVCSPLKYQEIRIKDYRKMIRIRKRAKKCCVSWDERKKDRLLLWFHFTRSLVVVSQRLHTQSSCKISNWFMIASEFFFFLHFPTYTFESLYIMLPRLKKTKCFQDFCDAFYDDLNKLPRANNTVKLTPEYFYLKDNHNMLYNKGKMRICIMHYHQGLYR